MNIQQKAAVKKNCSRAATITHTFWHGKKEQFSYLLLRLSKTIRGQRSKAQPPYTMANHLAFSYAKASRINIFFWQNRGLIENFGHCLICKWEKTEKSEETYSNLV